MNIIDAIASGKNFKRMRETCWISPTSIFSADKEDILADDWEIQKEPKQKRKLYKWAYRQDVAHAWVETRLFLRSESDFLDRFPYTDRIRLDYTMIEVEE